MAHLHLLYDWLKRRLTPEYDLGVSPPSQATLLADRLTSLLAYIEAGGVASSQDLIGCSEDEISALESKYGVTLPLSYRWYLATMGHKSGRLFTHDHVAVSYPDVISLTADYRETAAESSGKSFQLPQDAIIIAGRLFEQFQFIRCGNELDSCVWYFNEWDNQVVESKKSVVDWLYGLCDEAKNAIARGYYEDYPHGTMP